MFTFRSLRLIKRSLNRDCSSKNSFVDLSIDQEGIALISLQRQPVNSLNLDLLQNLSTTLDGVKKNQCKGLVITSATRVFSAGIDLTEFNKPDPARLRVFWTTIQDLFLKLYADGETTSAVAINGYTAAGGCVITLLCDYKVMVNDSKAKIGLNDSIVGVVPRPWICEIMNRSMGLRQAEIALTASTMYSTDEALKVNLIDEIAADKDEAIEKCKNFIRQYNDIPIKIRGQIKRNLRENIIRLVENDREEDIEKFINGIMNPYAQERIQFFMQQMKKSKSKVGPNL